MGVTATDGARQGRGQHHSSKAINRRDGQNGSSADSSDGAGVMHTLSAITNPIVEPKPRPAYTANNR